MKKDYQSEKIWNVATADKISQMSGDYSQSFKELLSTRGIYDDIAADIFINPKYEDLTSPDEIPGILEAVSVIVDACSANKKIAIYGDYDVDGVTATAILSDFFSKNGISTLNYIPSRFDQGYGLNKEAIKEIFDNGVRLIITVDCGSSSSKEVEYAKSLGLRIVITDHHTLSLDKEGIAIIPGSDAFVNCQQSKEVALRDLSGAGVAFYLVRALMTHFKDTYSEGQEKWLLDLVALGTICDIVPLTNDNRILAKYGLKVLSKSKRLGIVELSKVAEFSLANVDSGKVGFVIGPRLNAAGRIEHARDALNLLLTSDQDEAEKLATKLDVLNRERQEITEKIVESAIEIIENEGNTKPLYLLSGDKWPAGVVGIVASRLVDRYGKPMLVMEDMGEELKGSARSINDFNIVDALNKSSDLLIKFGGHAYAAGFNLKKDKFILLENKLIEIARAQIKTDNLKPIINIDEVIKVDEISTNFIDELSKMEPFGRGNARPVFSMANVKISSAKLVGNPPVHLKLDIAGSDKNIGGIAFGYGEKLDIKLDARYDLAFILEINEWNQMKRPEFRLIDLRKTLEA